MNEKEKNETNDQYYMDLGQKNFGSKTCELCGLLYYQGQVCLCERGWTLRSQLMKLFTIAFIDNSSTVLVSL